MEARSRIVLLRTPRTPDPYREVFERAGYDVYVVPVLRFDFVRGDELEDMLRRANAHRGIVVTSPRAVEALGRHSEHLSPFLGRPFYAAGPETARRARDLGFDPTGESAGSARALAEIIIESQPRQPLLFLSGNRRRDVLPDELRRAGITFDELTVYETHLRRKLEWPLTADDSARLWVAFFSPSGIEAAGADDRINRQKVATAAIGPTTAAALEQRDWRVDAVAEQPTPEGLLQAIHAAK